MRTSRNLIFIIAFLQIGIVYAQPSEAPTHLTLEKSIETALGQATAVLQSKSDVELSGATVLQSYGQFLPDLNVGGNYGYETGTTVEFVQGRVLEDISGRDAGFTITTDLNIFNGLADFNGLQSSLKKREAAKMTLDWAKIQVALDITQTYLQLVLDRLLLDIADKNLTASQARNNLIKGQARVGSASRADLFRQQAETSNDEFSKLSYETKTQNDQAALLKKLRLNPKGNYVFDQPELDPKAFPAAKKSLEDLLKIALHDRPDYRASKLLADASQADVRRSEAGYLPRIDLKLERNAMGRYLTSLKVNGVDSLGFDQPSLPTQLANQIEYTAMLVLTWNIFDHFNTQQNVEQQVNKKTYAEIAREDNEQQIYMDVKVAYANYQTALKQLETARTGLLASEKSYDVVEGLYEVGTNSIVDVLTAQAALSQARSNEAKALANLKLQEQAIQYSIGKVNF